MQIPQEQALMIIGDLFLRNQILVKQVEKLVHRNEELERFVQTPNQPIADSAELPNPDIGKSTDPRRVNGEG